MAFLQERRRHSGLLHSLYDVGEECEVAQATMKGEGVRELLMDNFAIVEKVDNSSYFSTRRIDPV